MSHEQQIGRRQALHCCGMGMGAVGLIDTLLQSELLGNPLLVEGRAANPQNTKAPHFPGKAKRVIHFFLNGGPSHVDSFDPKPRLQEFDGKAIPSGNLRTERKTGAAFASPFKFRKYGQSGIEVSDLFPHIGQCVDDIAVIRSMKAQVPNHEPSLMLMNCGDAQLTRPSVGSWVTYGLGAENQNLPSFIAMCPGGYPIKEAENWQSGFLPGAYQGTYIDSKYTELDKLIANIRNDSVSLKVQRKQLDLLQQLNVEHRKNRTENTLLEARIQSFELAYRMQLEAADAFDIAEEPQHIRDMYGDGVHSRQTLIARRLLERGVRFIQLWHGAGQPWDDHGDIMHHAVLAKEIDQPIAALIHDLKQRGMFEDTLIIFGGEFGRTPSVELVNGNPSKGRDHNPYGFSVWMAGGGIKGGTIHGSTDEFGFKAERDPVEVHDLHATILHTLGFDHEKLTYRYAARDFRLTDVSGHVIRSIVA